MNIQFKYIMVNQAFPVIFYGSFPHKAFSDIGQITSAGFIRIVPLGGEIHIETYGQSDGLHMQPAPEDAQIIALFLNKSLKEAQP